MSGQVNAFKSNPYKVGILSFSDGRKRVHDSLENAIKAHSETLRQGIEKDPLLEAVESDEIIYSSKMARENALQILTKGVEAFVFNVPVFAFPNFSLISARVIERPVILSSPKDGKLPGLGGIMAAHGAMKQIGLKSTKIWGNPLNEPQVFEKLSAFCRASGVIQRLKGSVYGLFGGRSIGMNTGVASAQQWMEKFGVDIEHIDQLEIIRRAKDADDTEVEKAYKWLCENSGRVCKTGKAQPEFAKGQIRHYLAIRSIINDLGIDFAGIKCHYDLSEYFLTACLSAVFLNDPYDWNGPKDTVATACEADSDGALTMQILKLISGFPTLLFDVRSYDFENNVFVCCNCGAQPSWFADRSSDPASNLSKIHVDEVISKYGGNGAHFSYVCKEGPATAARLSRENGEYRMFIAKADVVKFDRKKMEETCPAWPHAYLKMNISANDFIDIFNTNHLHIIPGDHTLALETYCKLMNISYDKTED
ncbi:MAG: hypothetical protein JW912_06020 [Sedimentisphaerales bacterium]|nr:hypothetical protein [Sedimentisphaerales bacterium]